MRAFLLSWKLLHVHIPRARMHAIGEVPGSDK